MKNVLLIVILFSFSHTSFALGESDEDKAPVVQATHEVSNTIKNKNIFVFNDSTETFILFEGEKEKIGNKVKKGKKLLEIPPGKTARMPYEGFNGRVLFGEVSRGMFRKNLKFHEVFRSIEHSEWGWIFNGKSMEKTSDLSKITALKR